MAISLGCKGNSNSSKHAILFLIILLFSARVCCDDHPHTSERISCLESERRALLAIKSDVYNSDDWLSSWIGHDCCEWKGVACDNTTNHVIRLDLHYPLDPYALPPNESKVNPSLFNLKHLKYLDLSVNSFSTHIPSMLSSLVHLEHLNLSTTYFHGLIPQQLGNLSNLRFLDLSSSDSFFLLWSNDISWLSHLTSLEHLDMSGVNLSLANSWFRQINYNSLEHLALSNCGLQVATGVSTSSNQMEDNIFVNTTRKLKHLDLALNSLTKIPLVMGSRIHLEYLDLSLTEITGRIPSSIGNLICLEYLNLGGNYIIGEIPMSMYNLVHLKYLVLSQNQITGEIPLSMGNLIHLEHLSLSDNQITGEIPFIIGNITSLISLHVSYNQITGEIPFSIGNITSLISLDVSYNEISGVIPDALCSLIYLEELSLWDNHFSGQIPRNIGRLHNLLDFDASMNNLKGQIPLSLGDLCNLESLDLYQNNIGGELTNLLDGLSKCPQGSKLQSLMIFDNKLSGLAPSNPWQLAQLQWLDISSNSLRGNITDAHFSKLTNLQDLNMSYNFLNLNFSDDWLPPFHVERIDMSYCHLGTKFPSWIQTQTTLLELSLPGVGLFGTIPAWFSNFILETHLSYLDLSSNELNGELPSILCTHTDLTNNSFEGLNLLSFAGYEVLKLSNNHISGSLPSIFCNLTSLFILDLSNNYLSGEIPNCYGSDSNRLLFLHLGNNKLSGSFPSFLKNCKYLVTLDLGGNEFSGEIPRWIGRAFPDMRFLCLSSNSFRGVIPKSITNLSSLQILDLSSNKLFGSIPSSLGNFSRMVVQQNYTTNVFRLPYKIPTFYDDSIIITAKGSINLYTKTLRVVTSIDLSNNELFGEIPKEITKLHGLCFLNLSNNHLTGTIPENIEVMIELESLDLSMNQLSGEIPSGLSTLNFLSYLNLSHNNLSGRIPTGGQFSTFNGSIYANNMGLCGAPLLECLNDEANDPSSQTGDKEDYDKLERILDYAFVVMGFIVGFWAYLGVIFMKKSTRCNLFRMVDKMYDWMYVQLSLKFGSG